MIPRILTAVVGLPVLIGVVWAGGYVFTALVFVIASIAAWELCRMADSWGQGTVTLIPVVASPVLAVAGFFVADLDQARLIGGLVSFSALLAAAVLLFSAQGRKYPFTSTLVAVCILLFIGGALFNATLLAGWTEGTRVIFFLLAVTFATDTGAYVVGKAVGSRKLAPRISPGKTWEGSVGGFVAAVLAGAAFSWVTELGVEWIVLASILGLMGQFGDLYESGLKRLAGFDDSGTIFPGHGGVLDRLDSILFNLIAVGLVVFPFL